MISINALRALSRYAGGCDGRGRLIQVKCTAPQPELGSTVRGREGGGRRRARHERRQTDWQTSAPGGPRSRTWGQNIIGYSLRGNRYLNVTNRCTLRCTFCPKLNGVWEAQGNNLRLDRDPGLDEIVRAAGDPDESNEVVFCGLGEPTLRLYTCLAAARRLRARGAYIRIVTDGLANLVYERDVTPDLEDIVHALSVSLTAQDEETYKRHCRPPRPGAYAAMLDFVQRAREFVPEITLTAIDGLPGVDIARCAEIAEALGVGFRWRVLGEIG